MHSYYKITHCFSLNILYTLILFWQVDTNSSIQHLPELQRRNCVSQRSLQSLNRVCSPILAFLLSYRSAFPGSCVLPIGRHTYSHQKVPHHLVLQYNTTFVSAHELSYSSAPYLTCFINIVGISLVGNFTVIRVDIVVCHTTRRIPLKPLDLCLIQQRLPTCIVQGILHSSYLLLLIIGIC